MRAGTKPCTRLSDRGDVIGEELSVKRDFFDTVYLPCKAPMNSRKVQTLAVAEVDTASGRAYVLLHASIMISHGIGRSVAG